MAGAKVNRKTTCAKLNVCEDLRFIIQKLSTH